MTTQPEPISMPAQRSLPSALSDAGRLVRPMAVLALLSVVFSQAFAPALKGVLLHMDTLINRVDVFAGIVSHLLALCCSALSIGLLLLIGRERRVPLGARIVLIVNSALVLVLGVPASRFQLSALACLLLGIGASVAALMAAVQGLRSAQSRAVGLVLALVSGAGVVRLIGVSMLVFVVTPKSPGSLQNTAQLFATASVILHSLGLLTALAWLGSRRKAVISISTMLALVVAVALTWTAMRGTQPQASRSVIVLARAVEQLLGTPASSLPAVYEVFVAVFGPVLALVALLRRHQVASVVGALALVLTAGTLVDMPGRALIMTLAALSTVLAARDERGTWEALLGRPLSPPPSN